MLSDIAPFRIAGGLYFVGTYAASSHLIDTGDGLILLDVGFAENAASVAESVSMLGFDVKNVRHIIATHGHDDHFGGIAELVRLSGAKTYIGAPDAGNDLTFQPDVLLQDGDRISCGNTTIECIATPGHTNGTFSFFFDVTENGKICRVGMFGGAGTNQLRKKWLDDHGLFYFQRGDFYRSIEKLRGQNVDIFLGNHSWNNDTRGKARQMQSAAQNPFIDPTAWEIFLDKCKQNMDAVIAEETRTTFVNYAHRGASQYCPENTMLSFHTGLFMRANGIETDVQQTKDGVLVLFHDKTLERVCGESGTVSDYTFAELQQFRVKKDGLCDKIPSFENFLQTFAFRDLTFAVELKADGIEEAVAELLQKYEMEKKCVVTAFDLDRIQRIKAYAPQFKTGYLTGSVDDALLNRLKEIGCDELCPKAALLTPENVRHWHKEGFRVRAWGIADEQLMQHALACGADGMTVNFPDKLHALL